MRAKIKSVFEEKNLKIKVVVDQLENFVANLYVMNVLLTIGNLSLELMYKIKFCDTQLFYFSVHYQICYLKVC